jgi:hypothetical protein
MSPKKIKQPPKLHPSHIKAKIIGALLIIIGLLLLLNPTPFFIKLAFAIMLIGFLMIVLISEQTIPRKIHSAQVEGNLAFVNKMINELKLTGKAIFLPKSRLLSEERVFIPAQKTTKTLIPYVDDDVVVTKGGLVVPPSGLPLLKKIEEETSFNQIGLENVEEKLQTFVGMNILKSVTLKKEPTGWKLELERPEPCRVAQPTCDQYPCSACSAVLTAITQATQEKIWIQDTTRVGNKTTYHLKIGE